jgi:proteasome assembly chaperone 3
MLNSYTQLQATIPDTAPLPPPSSTGIPEPPAAVHVHSLLGSAPTERSQALHSIYATHAATLLWINDIASATGSSRRPVIVGIALKQLKGDQQMEEAERMVFTSAMDMLAGLLRTT